MQSWLKVEQVELEQLGQKASSVQNWNSLLQERWKKKSSRSKEQVQVAELDLF